MLVTLDIDDEEASFFIKLAKSLPFVNYIKSTEINIDAIPEWHMPVIRERLENIVVSVFTDTDEFINSLKN